MYRGNLIVELEKDKITKVEELLRDKWKVSEIEITKTDSNYWISFATDDHKKVFKLKEIITNYGGKVLKQWIKKVEREIDYV
jgi:hypothetical protein